jgi:hypothetical protein
MTMTVERTGITFGTNCDVTGAMRCGISAAVLNSRNGGMNRTSRTVHTCMQPGNLSPDSMG